MKWKRQKTIVGRALYKSYSQLKQNALAAKMQRGYFNSSRLCGYKFDPSKTWLKHRCNKATCCQCNSRWGTKLAVNFLLGSKVTDKNQYRMMTLMFDLQPSVDDCFSLFDRKRDKIRRSIYKARETKKNLLLSEQWRNLSLSGSLEIDLFYKADFNLLGTEKKLSYEKDFGFQPSQWKGNNVFVPHYHGIVCLAGLDEGSLRERLEKFCRVFHFQPLEADQTLEEATLGILGYASKTWFETTLKDKRKKEWAIDEIQEYINCCLWTQGRKSFKFAISRYGRKRRK